MNNSGAEVLRQIFEMRSAKRAYSLRAFARDLGLSHTYLSLVLNDKKRLPLSTLRSVSEKLGLGENLVSEMSDEKGHSEKKLRNFARLEIDKFRLMSRWYYIALLDLLELADFTFSSAQAARYLDLELEDVREALSALRRLGMVKLVEGKWVKSESRLSIVAPASLEAIRAYHRQMILRAVEELEKAADADFKIRDITGMTMAINPRRISGAKRKIAKFRRSLEAYLTQGKRTEVYQFNIQLFTLRGAGRKNARGKQG